MATHLSFNEVLIEQVAIVVTEAATNVLKHAHATQAEVALEYAPDQLRIEVSDNGHGAARSDSTSGVKRKHSPSNATEDCARREKISGALD